MKDEAHGLSAIAVNTSESLSQADRPDAAKASFAFIDTTFAVLRDVMRAAEVGRTVPSTTVEEGAAAW